MSNDPEHMDDGGPSAFPIVFSDGSGSGGMSLRDWFAGMALSGVIEDHFSGKVQEDYSTDELADGISESSYRIADAMLVERKKVDAQP